MYTGRSSPIFGKALEYRKWSWQYVKTCLVCDTVSIIATMAPPKAFDFTGDVAIVSGAGSRMAGKSSFSPTCN